MPSTRVTKTTGETGRKVPVPRRWIRNSATPDAARSRWASTAARSSAGTSIGGMSVMWVGICVAVVSPTDVR